MVEFKPGDEVCVQHPQTQDGRWVFPGERLFVEQVNLRTHRAFVRCPAGHTSVWVDFEKLLPPSRLVDMSSIYERLVTLERQHTNRTTMLLAAVVGLLNDDDTVMLRLLTNAFATVDEDPDVGEALQEAATESAYEKLAEYDTPEVVSCDCPRSDEDVHTPSCPVLHQQLWGDDVPETAAEPVEDPDWRDNPYSLPPATTEGVKCLACSVQNRPHHLAGRLISHETVFHADQATADECVRRQDAMTYRHL
jgi:hypothetical protein